MIKLKSRANKNLIGIDLVYEDGSYETVAMVLMPPDGEFRATIEFYDDMAKAYRKRLSRWTNHPIR